MKVLGLGTAAIDTIFKCNSLPNEDGFASIISEKVVPGGSCANVLVTLSKLGIRSNLLVKIGDDDYGDILLDDIKKNNISTENIIVKEKGSTLRTFIVVGEQGKKMILSNIGDSLLDLKAEEVNESMIEDVDIFYTDMYPIKPALKLAKLCKDKGKKIAVNLQCSVSQMEGAGATLEEIEEMIKLSDIFCGQGNEMTNLSKESTYESAADTLFNKFKPSLGVVVTCGESGSIWRNQEGIFKYPSFKVISIDTTGAGDAFLGGFIYSVFGKTNTYAESLKFANACAAIKCTQSGPRIDINIDDVYDFINNI